MEYPLTDISVVIRAIRGCFFDSTDEYGSTVSFSVVIRAIRAVSSNATDDTDYHGSDFFSIFLG